MSLLESYQAKVTNFGEMGCQSANGKLIFKLRNAHNVNPVGKAINHPEQDLSINNFIPPSIFLPYNNWQTW